MAPKANDVRPSDHRFRNAARRFRLPFRLSIILMMLALSSFAYASDFEQAPQNPAFVRYQQKLVQGRLSGSFTASGHALGHIPSPVDISHAEQNRPPLSQFSAAIPATYDLRKTGKVTAVRDQGKCGACWAFATYGSLESYLMPSENWDFSEEDLNDTHGFDAAPCEGGNSFMSAAYLARWSGPVRESDVPYKYAAYAPQKHVQKVIYVPRTKYSFPEIKQAIIDHGGIDTSINWSDDYYNTSTYGYYYSGTSESNHDVTIVGWDDSYSKSNFFSQPPGDGAFIIRNSWGSSFGDGGYFYLSYYDTYAGYNCWAFHNAEASDNYLEKYEYDPLGWVGDYGYKTNTAWGANIFQAASSNSLKAVAFYATAPNLQYEVRVYTGVTAGNPISGSLALSQAGTLSEMGYHTVSLSQAVSLTAGQLFSVVVSFTTPNYIYPIPAEWPVDGYSSKAVAHAGESFFSSNGVNWTDVSATQSQINVCIKAFTGKAEEDCVTKWLKNNPATGAILQTELQDVNCVFNGIQSLLPEYLYPPTQTVAFDALAYRMYTSTAAFLGAWKSNSVKIFYLGYLSNNCPYDLGTIETLKPVVCTKSAASQSGK
ncbi:lectin like domain-containing protein [Desulfatirhabdium butyrativorans]|uniref:lectin like domain-containing protein n=1 Tax=Desulfatirhabdium butyrativorans TaxID=340467 RepID=UPI000688687D|nr:lectin like domain-containing protein [Desulfatirhabdium butyrativorans]